MGRASKGVEMRRQPQSLSSDRGASLVEFALIAPLLFAILLGMITGGLALSKKNSMTNAVREGGRLGATLPEGTDWDSDWAVDVRDRVDALAGGDLDPQDICVQLIDPTAPGTPVGELLGADCSAVTPPDTPSSASGCVVKVWARTDAGFETVFFRRTVTLDGNAVGLYERDECPGP
tara:strand:- start:373 stop:903 length:531 start_codon:yes stop_codon:yes gene_type:complete